MNTRLPHAFLSVLLATAAAWAQAPLGTALTYQGHLKDAGAPANGNYDLSFTLYDATVGGAIVGSDTADDWPVAAGLFTAWLDFGAGAFNGQARWLEIGVRPWDSGGAYTALTPRQELTPTPYGLYAASAANADTVDGLHAAAAPAANTLLPLDATAKFPNSVLRTGAGNSLDADLLDGQHGSFYQNASNFNAGTLADARLTANVAMLQTNQTFTGGKAFSAAPAFTAGGAPFTVTSSTLVTNLNADRLDGLDSTAFLQSVPNPLTLSGTSATHIIRGENASNTSQTAGVTGVSTGSGGGLGVLGQQRGGSGWFPTTGAGVFGTSNSSFGVAGFSSTGDGMWAITFGTSGVTHGLTAESRSTSGIGVKGTAATASSGTTYGGYFESAGDYGSGVYGSATSAGFGTTYGGYFESACKNGYGVYGSATATGSGVGNTYGGYFVSAGQYGTGVYGVASGASTVGTTGVYGKSYSTGGIGVEGRVVADSGATYGVYGLVDSTAGRGVYGLAFATSGSTFGGYFESDSTAGYGVYARANATSGTIYGVRGVASTAAAGYAVYAVGDMGASGSKPFRIDHPLDPENKYLLHYATESPEILNFYRGTVGLDERGEAVVELPDYFATINKTPSYQLTAVGAPMPNLHVADEISEEALWAGEQAGPGDTPPTCSFRIAGGLPGGRVSWRIEAVRNDLRMRTRGAPVEQEKTGPERGKYQHPEYYGQPAEMGMDHSAERVHPAHAETQR